LPTQKPAGRAPGTASIQELSLRLNRYGLVPIPFAKWTLQRPVLHFAGAYGDDRRLRGLARLIDTKYLLALDYWLVGLSFVAAYVAVERATFAYQLDGLGITLWSPSAGLSVVLLMGPGLAYAPFVFAASLITDFAVYAGPRGWIAPAATSLVLTIGLGAIALGLGGKSNNAQPRLGSVVTLLTVVPTGVLMIAVVYCSMLYATDHLSPWSYLLAIRNFWIGDTLGIITVVPAAAATLRAFSARWHAVPRSLVADASGFAVALLGALWIVFGLQRAHEYQFFYLLFLPIVWIAVRRGYAGVSIALVVAHVLLVTVATLLGYAAYDFIAFQMLMLVLSATGLLLGAAVTEGRCSEERIRVQQSELARAARHALVGATGTALAHEISQPLSSATNYLHAAHRILRAGANVDPAVTKALAKAEAEARRARETLERVRDYVSSGRLEITQVDVEELVGKIVHLIGREADARGVAIEITTGPHLPTIAADAIQIEQLLLNLLSNAVDAASENTDNCGRVALLISQRRDRVAISVEDNGRGIAAEMADRLFEPFETTKQHGMGLGLTLVRQILEAHRGGLHWENRASGGARFTAELNIDGPRRHAV
jgi:two-component system sensor kinase FixL